MHGVVQAVGVVAEGASMTRAERKKYEAKYRAKSGAGVPMGAPERIARSDFDDRAAAKFWTAYLIIITLWVSLIVYWAWQK